MKSFKCLAGVLSVGVALALAGGCANSKREQSLHSGVSSMNNVSVMLDTVNARIDGTYEAMNQLKVQGVDQGAAAKGLDEQIKLLDEAAEDVREEGKQMRAHGDAYFVEWEKEHARNAGVSTGSVSVSQAERDSYGRLMDAMEMAGTDFRELSDSLRTLQREATGGYTQAEIAPLVERTNMRAIDARNAITALQGELNRIITNYRAQYGR